jgi:hypothetical protein
VLVENDIATGELLFEWNALEHVDPSGKSSSISCLGKLLTMK